ncbi:MAG TPA: dolichyl-phosphate beta-glucosyltransferase [Vicinamibacterales bacterium]|nr:dolichyl-phosphate beta-glucosyltransferase [Vicinamibacterales bacterium]
MSATGHSHAQVFLSVVIPAFNEVARIGATVSHVCSYLDAQPWTWEVVVVLDGGRGGAADEVRAAAAGRASVRLLDNLVNRGKGFSVRRGLLAARGRYRLFIDADLSLPIQGVAAMIAALEEGSDVAIGSRTAAGSVVRGARAPLRQTMGGVFNAVVRLLAVSGVRDTQCGFKGFRDDAAERIFRLSRIDRFGFDVEALRLAQRFGYRIAEIPVACTYRPSSSVRRVWDAASMFADVLRVRWYEATGRYRERREPDG